MKIGSLIFTRHPRMAVGVITDIDYAGLIRVSRKEHDAPGVWMRESDVLDVVAK